MPMRWRKPRLTQTLNPDPVDLNTLRTELHRATDVTVERVAAIVDDRLDGYHADLLKRHQDLVDELVSLTIQVRSMERHMTKIDAVTTRNLRLAGVTAGAVQDRQARRHAPLRSTALDEPF